MKNNVVPDQMLLNAFTNRADPDQAALVKVLPDQGLLCLLLKYEISDPTLADLTNHVPK